MGDNEGAKSHPNQRLQLAYENEEYLKGPDGRILRIMAEYQEPLSRFMRERVEDTIVFLGSARFRSRETAVAALHELRRSGGDKSDLADETRRAESDVRMSRYYEDARRLAFLISKWTQTIAETRHRFVVCTGGGPGIMEAANRGASEAGSNSIGLNIELPFQQVPNPYITHDLNFEFHYPIMRKLWFAYLAKALVVFPGGFGTMNLMFELLRLVQMEKLAKHIGVVVYGKSYWDTIFNFQGLIDYGTISARDRDLIQWVNTPEEAFEVLRADLERHHLEQPGSTSRPPDIGKLLP